MTLGLKMAFRLCPISSDARRQYVNARATYLAYLAATQEAQHFEGRMFFRRQHGKEYLVRTSKTGAQKGLGARSPETEAKLANFQHQKLYTTERRDSLRTKVVLHAKLNCIYALNRASSILVGLFNRIHTAGLAGSVFLIDENVLHCYSTIAGLKIEPASGTRAICGAPRKMSLSLAVTTKIEPSYLVAILRSVDSSFRFKVEGRSYTFVNKKGDEVHFIVTRQVSREASERQGSMQPTVFWSAENKAVDWILSAPMLECVLVSEEGNMALVSAADPRAYVLHNLWMSKQGHQTLDIRRQEAMYALTALDIVETYLWNFCFDELGISVTDLRKALS